MIAWVTGGGTGIGRALAEQLYLRGDSVIITGRRADVLERTAGEISASSGSGKIHFIVGDVADPTHAQQVVADTKARWGDIDLLINNAGSNFNRSVARVTTEEFSQAFQINCLGAIQATQAVLPAMKAKGAGQLVYISSIYGKWGTATSGSYSVSKFALTGYAEAIRQYLATSPVHVLSVFPGYIQTAMTDPFVVKGSLRSRMGKTPTQMAQAILRALGRRQSELYFPWYVSWVLRLHRWAPLAADRLAMKVKR